MRVQPVKGTLLMKHGNCKEALAVDVVWIVQVSSCTTHRALGEVCCCLGGDESSRGCEDRGD